MESQIVAEWVHEKIYLHLHQHNPCKTDQSAQKSRSGEFMRFCRAAIIGSTTPHIYTCSTNKQPTLLRGAATSFSPFHNNWLPKFQSNLTNDTGRRENIEKKPLRWRKPAKPGLIANAEFVSAISGHGLMKWRARGLEIDTENTAAVFQGHTRVDAARRRQQQLHL